MKNLLLIILLSISGICLNAQSNLDSLYAIWQDETVSDTIRVDAYQNYIWNGFMFSNSDTAFILAQNLLDFGDERFYAGAKINAYYLMGVSNYLKSDYTKALDYYQRSLKINEEIGDKKASASTINNIGIIYKQQGEYPKALKYCNKGLKISQEIGALLKEKQACKCLYEIYKFQGNTNEALVYIEKLNIIEDSLNVQETTKKLQQMEFQKQVLEDSLAREKVILLEKQKKEEIIQAKKRQNQIQYSLMVMFVLFLAALIAAMTKFSYKPRMAAALIFIFFILIFEFLLVLLNPWVDTITNGEVGFKIILNTLMAILIFGLHQISEKRIKKILIK